MGHIPRPVSALLVKEGLHIQGPQVTLWAQECLQAGAGEELPQQCLVLLSGPLEVLLHTAKAAPRPCCHWPQHGLRGLSADLLRPLARGQKEPGRGSRDTMSPPVPALLGWPGPGPGPSRAHLPRQVRLDSPPTGPACSCAAHAEVKTPAGDAPAAGPRRPVGP